MDNEIICHCGKPLHYTDEIIKSKIMKIISELGEFVIVTIRENNKSYMVPRHYIALHGLTGKDVPNLGFSEVRVK